MIETIASVGSDEAGGATRLAYTAEERRGHALVGGWLEELGVEVTQDSAGNTLARRPGRDAKLPTMVVGSHLDSVPHGGKFDGVAGVVSMVELMRFLARSGTQTWHPVSGVVFAAEEGARFGEPCLGSKFATGVLREHDLDRLHDASGISLRDAMASVGLSKPDFDEVVWTRQGTALYLELHVEQGEVLDIEGRQIGLVDDVSGSTRLMLTFEGQANHSGATPMCRRHDALAGASEMIMSGEALASDTSHRGLRVTVGNIDVWPNQTTTIAGRVTLIVDVRSTDSARQRQTAAQILEDARSICERRGLTFKSAIVADTSPTTLSMWVREKIRKICEEQGIDYRVMRSGATHDAQVVSRLVPAALVFVPSREGRSHVPQEWTSTPDIARGADLLLASLLDLDRFLADGRAHPDGVMST